jgi:hypothetical protein
MQGTITLACGLYYKPMTIVNDDARVVNKLEASLADDASVKLFCEALSSPLV